MEIADIAVVHKQVLPVTERMAVGFIDAAGLGCCPNMCKYAVAGNDARYIMQVTVVPGRSDGSENGGFLGKVCCIPTDTESVAIQRLDSGVSGNGPVLSAGNRGE